jgi:cation-transporting P-type ATPase E
MTTYIPAQKTHSTEHSLMLQGLSEREVETRRASGQGNVARLQASRSYLQIVRENVFTSVNTILFVLGFALIVLGQTSDAITNFSKLLVLPAIGAAQR